MSLTDSTPTTGASPWTFDVLLGAIQDVRDTLGMVEADLPGLNLDASQLALLHAALVGLSGAPGRVVAEDGLAHSVQSVAAEVQRLFVQQVGEGGGVNVGALRCYVDRTDERPQTDWELLLPQVAAKAYDDWRAMADPETGEAPAEPLELHVARLVGRVAGVTPSKTPGKKACKALGIDADRYVTTERGRLRVNWTAADTRTRHPGDKA